MDIPAIEAIKAEVASSEAINVPAALETKGKRRIYMFRSPISILAFTGSFSNTQSAGNNTLQTTANQNWDDTTDPDESPVLPKLSISIRSFDMKCHIGVIIIDDTECRNTNTPLDRKLSGGMVYEHPGKKLPRAICGIGTRPSTKFVRSITALERIGHTRMQDSELNILLQDILAVDRSTTLRPHYRPIYWNCHDIAVRFALLAAEDYTGLHIIQRLADIFEHAKFELQRAINKGTGLLSLARNCATAKGIQAAWGALAATAGPVVATVEVLPVSAAAVAVPAAGTCVGGFIGGIGSVGGAVGAITAAESVAGSIAAASAGVAAVPIVAVAVVPIVAAISVPVVGGLCADISQGRQLYHALKDRRRWAHALEERYPQLKRIRGMDEDEWAALAASVSVFYRWEQRGWI